MTRSTLPSIAASRRFEGDRGDRRRGVVADPRQSSQCLDLAGKVAAMPVDHRAGAGMKVTGTGVIAEPLPEPQDLVERGRGQCRDIGPARHESVKITSDRCYCRLLQHDLAEATRGRDRRACRVAPATVVYGGWPVIPGHRGRQNRAFPAARQRRIGSCDGYGEATERVLG